MRNLTPRELAAILPELQRQMALQHYSEQRNHWAFLAAVITNAGRMIASAFGGGWHSVKAVEPDDFMGKDAKKTLRRLLGEEPERDWSKHIEDARAKGLRGPE
jgi:hypothetical protein